MNDFVGKRFVMEKAVPEVGDNIYVPSILADDSSKCAWTQMKKKGGYATVGLVQSLNDEKHLVFVTEYGGYGMWWEDYLKPMQDELAERYGVLTQAQILIK